MALKLMALGRTLRRPMAWNNAALRCQCCAWQALMAAVELTTDGWSPATSMAVRKESANCQCFAFSQELMRALKVITS